MSDDISVPSCILAESKVVDTRWIMIRYLIFMQKTAVNVTNLSKSFPCDVKDNVESETFSVEQVNSYMWNTRGIFQ